MGRKEVSVIEPANIRDLSALLTRVAELEERVKKLEVERNAAVAKIATPAVAARTESAPVSETPAILPPAPKEEISEEIVTVISAAVAAFLGKRAHVRQIRLVSSEAWAQQGRVSIMASHRWAVQR